MSELEDAFEVLTRLGLTKNQARVYLSLINSVELTVTQISQKSKIGREEIYKITPKLQNKGLIQASITNPVKFSAIPFQVAVEILMEIRRKETDILHTKAKDCALFVNSSELTNIIYEPKLTIISGKERLVKFSTELLDGVRKSLDIVCTNEKLRGWLHTHEGELLKLLGKGIHTRFIIDTSEGEKSSVLCENLLKYSTFNLKVISREIPVCIGIYDDREITIVVLPKTIAYGSPIYWSNNSVLIEMGKGYFEKIWN